MSVLCDANMAGSFGNEPVLPTLRPRTAGAGSSPTASFASASPRATAHVSPASSARSSSSASPSTMMTPDKLAAYRTLSQHGYGVSELGTPSSSASSRPRVTVGFKIREMPGPAAPSEQHNLVHDRIPSPMAAAGAPLASACAANSSEEHSPSPPAATAAADPFHASPADEGAACCSPETLCRTMSATRVGSSGILLMSAGNTGGGSTRAKKHLAWADEIGNSLSTRVFFDADAAPSCRSDRVRGRFPPLSIPSMPFPALASPGSPGTPRLHTELENACSALPHSPAEIQARLLERTVLLESVSAMAHSPLVMLNVRVRNIAYEKCVIVRLTKDCWASHYDVDASFMPGCLDGGSDRFYATVSVSPAEAEKGVQFALCFRAGGREYWDNNNGNNYRLFLAPSAPPAASSQSALYASPRFTRINSDSFFA